MSTENLALSPVLGPSPIPALIGGILTAGLIRTGFGSFFFLLPLGIVVSGWNSRTGWLCCLTTALGNLFLSLSLAWGAGVAPLALVYDFAYFNLMIAGFTWVLTPVGTVAEPGRKNPLRNLPGVWRLSIAAMLGAALVLLGFSMDGGLVADLFGAEVEMVAALYSSMDQPAPALTAEAITRTLEAVMYRGGVLVSLMALFYGFLRLSQFIARLARRRNRDPGLAAFRVDAWVIWPLSLSIAALVLGLSLGIDPLEIGAWNVLVLCVILYLAQGWGIVSSFFSRPVSRSAVSPGLRLLLNVIFVILLFSPGINAILLGALALLGVAENWLPLRGQPTKRAD
ncbi:MAG: YybS family protein [Treponema sp.]|jgi:hypothetical protein|nr:YybS family protein [Treponema sp.]